MLNDLRFALRQLRKSPGFTLAAVLTLAIGIGATVSIFTLVYDAMLRPLPFSHADRLVTIQEHVAEWSDLYPELPVSANHFTFWEKHSHSFAAMSLMEEYSLPLGANGRPSQVGILSATPGTFSALQVKPRLGRAFTVAEAQPGHEHVAVLTYNLWREQFGGDSGIVGKTITLDGFPYTVIGVMPQSFHMPPVQSIDSTTAHRAPSLGVLVPMAFSKDRLAEAMGDLNYFGLARLKPGISITAANAELNAEQRMIASTLPPDEKATLSAVLTPFQAQLVGNNKEPLIILLVAVAGLLLVGCINIANLLLARATAERKHMAVAAALGARHRELFRMAMRDIVVLAIAGGGLGILFAATLVPAMQRYLPPALDFRGPLHLDWAGASCAVLLSVMAALFAGIVPAWMSARIPPHEVLHSESRLATESKGSKRIRRLLVGFEVAVSVALVLMTGLLTQSLVKLMRVNRGFSSERTMTATIDLPSESYPNTSHRAEFYKQALARLNHLPRVQHAAIISALPLAGDSWGDFVRLPGDNRSWTQLPGEHFRWMSPGYLQAIHLPLLEGRHLTESDSGKNVAIISELTAKTLWHNEDPVGRQFVFAMRTGEKPFTVIGVVKNARTITLAKPDPMMIYVPYWYRCEETAALVVRTTQAPATIADAIRKTIWSVDPSVPVPTVRTLDGIVADSVANRRFEMDLLLLFAISALLLAALGVYGVVSYSVAQRQREIGLRIALGAQRANVYRLVLSEGLLPVVLGTIAGIALAFALGRVIRGLLFGVSPHNPVIAAGAACLLVLLGTAATLIPAHRAAMVDPMESLRNE